MTDGEVGGVEGEGTLLRLLEWKPALRRHGRMRHHRLGRYTFEAGSDHLDVNRIERVHVVSEAELELEMTVAVERFELLKPGGGG